jgi:peptidoglycan-associated lipoprotein
MTRVHSLAVGTASIAAACALACGPRPVTLPPLPTPDSFVLLPNPDTGALGRARVSSSTGTVDLVHERDATSVAANSAPVPVFTMSEADVQRIFGGALSSLPPSPRVFNLYFQFESDVLTNEARTLLPEILRVVKERPFPDVVVVGHTDTTGTTAANLELGLKRAMTVTALLVRAGFDVSAIEVTSLGEGDPLVPTPDETREARNRRVEVAVR